MAKGKRKGRDDKWMLDRAFMAPVQHRKSRAEVNSGYLKGVWADTSPPFHIPNAEGQTLSISGKLHLKKFFLMVIRVSNMPIVSLRRRNGCRGTVDKKKLS